MINNYYDEAYIEDTFREVIEDTTPFEHTIQGVSLFLILSNGVDEEPHKLLYFLEDNSPNLFTVVPAIYDLHQVMLECAILSYNYIHNKNSLPLNMKKTIKAKFPKLRNKQGQDKKIERFKNNLNSIFNAVGGEAVNTTKGAELTKLLRDAYLNPEEYIPASPTIEEPSTEPIREYLVSLQLEGKSKLIDEYIRGLASL